MSLESTLNFRRVSDTITTSGAVPADDLAQLGALGYEVVINLMPDDSDWAVAGEADIVSGQGIHYVAIPVDFAAPTPADFDAFTTAMDAAAGKTVHVHCAANYRVSAFYSVYAMAKGWWTKDDADALLSTIWTAGEYPVWDEFVEAQRAQLAR